MQLDLSSFAPAIGRHFGAHPCVTKSKVTTGKSYVDRRRQSMLNMSLLWTTAELQRVNPDLQQIRNG
jgi:hypothetical protein